MAKRVFIGSSSESLPVARAVQSELRSYKSFSPVIWNQGIIRAGRYTIPELIKELTRSDYAIFIFSDDDKLYTRRKTVTVPRDNVVFECGLATGMIGISNCFVLKSKKAKIPSDYDGLSVIEYELINKELSAAENLRAELAPAVDQFVVGISENSPKESSERVRTWLNYCDALSVLCNKLAKSPRNGGFRFDAIIGITRGGIIAADIINRKCMTPVPLACITPGYSSQGNSNFDIEEDSINYWALNAMSKYQNILLVDDISRTGQTLPEAKNLLTYLFPDKNIKTAAVFVSDAHKKDVDYYGATSDGTNIMPYSII